MKKLLPVLYSPYFLIVVGFIIWMTFFDRNNWIATYKTIKSIQKMEPQLEHYRQEAEKNQLLYRNILHNDYVLEKYAREVFKMKKKNEDIYIIENND